MQKGPASFAVAFATWQVKPPGDNITLPLPQGVPENKQAKCVTKFVPHIATHLHGLLHWHSTGRGIHSICALYVACIVFHLRIYDEDAFKTFQLRCQCHFGLLGTPVSVFPRPFEWPNTIRRTLRRTRDLGVPPGRYPIQNFDLTLILKVYLRSLFN